MEKQKYFAVKCVLIGGANRTGFSEAPGVCGTSMLSLLPTQSYSTEGIYSDLISPRKSWDMGSDSF